MQHLQRHNRATMVGFGILDYEIHEDHEGILKLAGSKGTHPAVYNETIVPDTSTPADSSPFLSMEHRR